MDILILLGINDLTAFSQKVWNRKKSTKKYFLTSFFWGIKDLWILWFELDTFYEALQDRVYILLPPRCKKYCTTFCICWTPTLRLKMTATDQAFRWCRLSVLFFSFSHRKCGVCPKKVGKMAFIGCSEFQWTKFA